MAELAASFFRIAVLLQGKATGERAALWLRARLQSHLFQLGCFLHRHAGKVLFVGVLVLATFCVGLKSAKVHTRVDQLWVEGKEHTGWMSDRQFLKKYSVAWNCLMSAAKISLLSPIEFSFVGSNYRNETINVNRHVWHDCAADGIRLFWLTKLSGGAVASSVSSVQMCAYIRTVHCYETLTECQIIYRQTIFLHVNLFSLPNNFRDYR